MPITPTRPLVVQAIPEKTFDIFWLQSFQMIARSSAEPVQAMFTIIPQNSGTGELAPQERAVRVNIEDVFALAGTNPLVAAAVEAVLAAVESVAKNAGSI